MLRDSLARVFEQHHVTCKQRLLGFAPLYHLISSLSLTQPHLARHPPLSLLSPSSLPHISASLHIVTPLSPSPSLLPAPCELVSSLSYPAAPSCPSTHLTLLPLDLAPLMMTTISANMLASLQTIQTTMAPMPTLTTPTTQTPPSHLPDTSSFPSTTRAFSPPTCPSGPPNPLPSSPSFLRLLQTFQPWSYSRPHPPRPQGLFWPQNSLQLA